MNWWLGKLNKSGPLAVTKPITDNISPALALVDSGSGPTPQNPGDYRSINISQMERPNFASKADRKQSEQIRKIAKDGETNAIAVMNNLAAADKSAVKVEKYYYGTYRQILTDNYKERIKAKAGDMKRLHKTRVYQANTIHGVNQASSSANDAIARIGQKKKEIENDW